MIVLLIITVIGLVHILRLAYSRGYSYPFSNTGKPFIKRDVDGYMTSESYKSHIKVYGNGSLEVDTWALTQTRDWATDMAACKRLHKCLQERNSQR